MKHYYNKKSLPIYVLSFLVASLFVSCGTMQTTTSNNDGIYDDNEVPQRKVVVVNDTQYQEYNDNYFTQELKRLDYINGTDVITDIEDYNSGNYEYEETLPEEEEVIERNNYGSWGNSEVSDVVVYIDSGFNNSYGYYGWNNPWAFRRGFGWGFNSFWHPYHSSFYWNQGFYGGIAYNNPFFYGGFYRNYGIYRNYNRNGYRNNRYSRYNSRNNVAYNSRRNNNVYSRRSNTSARNNSKVYRRSASSSRATTNSSRSASTSKRTAPARNTKTNSYRRSSNSSSRASSNNRSSSRTYSNRSSNSSSRSSSSGRSSARSSGSRR